MRHGPYLLLIVVIMGGCIRTGELAPAQPSPDRGSSPPAASGQFSWDAANLSGIFSIRFEVNAPQDTTCRHQFAAASVNATGLVMGVTWMQDDRVLSFSFGGASEAARTHVGPGDSSEFVESNGRVATLGESGSDGEAVKRGFSLITAVFVNASGWDNPATHGKAAVLNITCTDPIEVRRQWVSEQGALLDLFSGEGGAGVSERTVVSGAVSLDAAVTTNLAGSHLQAIAIGAGLATGTARVTSGGTEEDWTYTPGTIESKIDAHRFELSPGIVGVQLTGTVASAGGLFAIVTGYE